MLKIFIIAQGFDHAGKGFIDDCFLLPDHPVDIGGRSTDFMRQFGLRCPGFNAHDFYIDLNVVFDHDPYSFDSQIEIAHKRQLIISQYSMDFQYSGVLFACS